MGYIEIIRPDGTGLSNKKTQDLVDTTFMFCDKCQSVEDTIGGKYIEQDGLNIMWWCKDCR
jgi:hypothetical protein